MRNLLLFLSHDSLHQNSHIAKGTKKLWKKTQIKDAQFTSVFFHVFCKFWWFCFTSRILFIHSFTPIEDEICGIQNRLSSTVSVLICIQHKLMRKKVSKFTERAMSARGPPNLSGPEKYAVKFFFAHLHRILINFQAGSSKSSLTKKRQNDSKSGEARSPPLRQRLSTQNGEKNNYR